MELPTLEQYLVRNKKERSERDMLLKDIYAQYDTAGEDWLRKLKNIERYKVFLKEQRKRNSGEMVEAFKKDKRYLKKIPPTRFWFFLSHVPTKDLYHILSVSKDKAHRKESVGAFIFSLVKYEVRELQ
jgi:hypothetical protein